MPFRAAVMKIALHRFVNLLSGSKRQTGEVFLYMAEAYLPSSAGMGRLPECGRAGRRLFLKKSALVSFQPAGKIFQVAGLLVSERHERLLRQRTTGFGAFPAGGILLRGACKNRPTCSCRNAGRCFHDVENQMFLGVGLQHYCKPALPETGCRRT